MFDEAIGLDPDADMLAEGARRAKAAGVDNVRWVRALAEDIPSLGLGSGFRLVTFGSSYHWTDREQVGNAVYELLEPGGVLACVVHTVEGRPKPDAPPEPELPTIPYREIKAMIERYVGPQRYHPPPDRFEDALRRTRFGESETVFIPGRPDIVRDIDSVVAGYYSMSWATPPLFGDRRDEFEAEVRALLGSRSERGLFWDWPGDTEIVIARKPDGRSGRGPVE